MRQTIVLVVLLVTAALAAAAQIGTVSRAQHVSVEQVIRKSNTAQPATISSVEAKSLVQAVLKNRNIHLSAKYCELKALGRDGKPFVADYYTLGASCDYPNTAATTSFGVYVVSPRTGHVWEFNICEQFSFPTLTRIQKDIKQRTGNTDIAEAKYREQMGCDTARGSLNK
jgi:hypothetical protein